MRRGLPLYVALAFALGATVSAAVEDTELLQQKVRCNKLLEGNDAVVGCVRKDEMGAFAFEEGSADAGCIASATYIDSIHTVSGFGKLRVVTHAGFSDADQLYAAGFAEGWLTAARIYDHHHNLKAYFVDMLNATLDGPLEWLAVQDEWLSGQVAAADPAEPYWRLLGLLQRQFDGMVDGYQARAQQEAEQGAEAGAAGGGQQRRRGTRRLAGAAGKGKGKGGDDDVSVGWLDRRELVFLNSNGDIYDIMDALDAGHGYAAPGASEPDTLQVVHRDSGSLVARLRSAVQREQAGGGRLPRGMDVDPDAMRMSLKLGLQGKCSALIKVTGDLGELLLGHSTHDSYTAMTRLYKHFDFGGVADAAVAAKRVSFSSYPGELFSDDDWYLLSSGLFVTETTNHIYNGDVFEPMQPRCVLSWQRIRLANWVATSGEEWVAMFARHNSGTYNNQYMVVDTKRFVPHTEMQPGLLWVVEQLPGFLQAGDMTDELSRGYWPSYNVAFFPQVYEAAGYPYMIEQLEKEGAKKYAFSIRLLKYQIAPRAAIFRRDQGAVSTLEQLKAMMRYNDFQHDPYAEGNPVGAVCGRGDLAKGDAALAKGCYDSKVTSASLAARMESDVVAGPTTQGQPPFSWSDPRWAGLPHRGMPDTFNYTYERMTPKDLPTLAECREALGEGGLAAARVRAAAGRAEEQGVQAAGRAAEGGVAEEAVEEVARGAEEVGRLLGKLVLPRDVRARNEAAAAA